MTDEEKRTSFSKRQQTLKRKAYELETLCGTIVCLICYGSDGKLETWPEEKNKVTEILMRWKNAHGQEGSKKRKLDIEEFVKTKKIEFSHKKESCFEKKFPSWDKRLDRFSKDKLSVLETVLETKLHRLMEKLKLLVERKSETVLELGGAKDYHVVHYGEGSLRRQISGKDGSRNLYAMPTDFQTLSTIEGWPYPETVLHSGIVSGISIASSNAGVAPMTNSHMPPSLFPNPTLSTYPWSGSMNGHYQANNQALHAMLSRLAFDGDALNQLPHTNSLFAN